MHISHQLTLTTPRLELRLITAEHSQAFSELIQNSPSLHQWLDWCHPDFSAEESEEFILANRVNWLKGLSFGFGVFEKESGAFAGMAALTEHSRSFNLGALGYWVGDAYQQQGYAAEALHPLIRHCFRTLRLTRLEIICDPENCASHRVAEKTGATKETLARNRFVFNGQPKDGLVYSLIPTDLPEE